MKKNFIITALILLISTVEILNAQETGNDQTHTREGFMDWGNGNRRLLIFNSTDKKSDYYYIFPTEEFRQLNSEDFHVDFRTNTSVKEAELALVERLEATSLGLYNMVDTMLPNGPIGSNCWYNLSHGTIIFIRNNIFVWLIPKHPLSQDIGKSAEILAKNIDSLILKSEKVKDIKLLNAPTVQSVSFTSELPKGWEEVVYLKISAKDPGDLQLFYRGYANIKSRETEEMDMFLYKTYDAELDTGIAYMKIWVWNEKNVYTLHHEEISF